MSETNSEKYSEKGYEFIDHPADIWVHAWGPTLADAFEQCVYALMKTMTDPSKIEEKIEREIVIKSFEIGTALVNFLSEFLYLFDTEGLIFKTVKIDPIVKDKDDQWIVKARAKGEVFDPEKHFQDTEVKAITYSYLEIKRGEKRVDIKIVYDI